MEKPIIATTLSGLFIKHEPWQKAHILWFQERGVELREQNKDDSAIKEWRILLESDPEKEAKEYFKFVDLVMKELHPEFLEEDLTRKARELFFEAVLTYIELYPEVINQKIVDYFKLIKNKFRLALITTNTEKALDKILAVSGLNDLFDITECSLPEEKDDKTLVFERFIEKHGKPLIYIGGDKKSSYDYCKENDIQCAFANIEGDSPIGIECVETLNSLEEIEEKIKILS